MLEEKLLEHSIRSLCTYYKSFPHELIALQFMVWQNQTWNHPWDLTNLSIEYMKLVYILNPSIFQSQVEWFRSYKETKFWMQHGGQCELENMLKNTANSRLPKYQLFKLLDLQGTQITDDFVFHSNSKLYEGSSCAEWIIRNIVKNKSLTHYEFAFEIAQVNHLPILFHDNKLEDLSFALNGPYEEPVMEAWINHYGLDNILTIIREKKYFQLYRYIPVRNLSFDEAQRLVQIDPELIKHLKLYLMWPYAFPIQNDEHFIVQSMYKRKRQ